MCFSTRSLARNAILPWLLFAGCGPGPRTDDTQSHGGEGAAEGGQGGDNSGGTSQSDWEDADASAGRAGQSQDALAIGVNKDASPTPLSSDPSDAGAPVDEPPGGWVRAIVAVGSGAGRIRSLDQGLTWRDSSRFANGGGDDMNLLRSVTYGRGRWIAVGWKLLVSTDAVQWSERKSPCGLSTGVAYGNGWFVMTCNGRPFRSRDAVTWTQGGNADVGGHPLVLFDGKRFVSWGDGSRAFESVDADTWKVLAGVDDISYCDGMVKPTRNACGEGSPVWADGVSVRGWGGTLGSIMRSTDRRTWKEVHRDSYSVNYEAFAFGFAPP